MATTSAAGAAKFDRERAGEYEKQSRIALAGYDACHELSACMLVATLGAGTTASILVVGAGGTAQEIITLGQLEPNWRFTAIDPSESMLDLAVQRLKAEGLAGRTDARLGYVEDLRADAQFDAATLIGVLHHLPGTEAKAHILESIATRLKPGAPLILACNHYTYASQPLLLAAWGERWRMQGASAEEVKAKLGKIMQGADPPHSEAVVTSLLDGAGFGQPTRFFASLFWGAWLARRVIKGSASATTRAPT
jgi:tRNA (cmo5U34)-methyltransferase